MIRVEKNKIVCRKADFIEHPEWFATAKYIETDKGYSVSVTDYKYKSPVKTLTKQERDFFGSDAEVLNTKRILRVIPNGYYNPFEFEKQYRIAYQSEVKTNAGMFNN